MYKIYRIPKLSKFPQKTLDIENEIPYNSRPQTMRPYVKGLEESV